MYIFNPLVLTLAAAALVTAGLIPVTIAASRRFGLLDLPDSRKVHTVPTPRLGGVAMAGGMLVAATPVLAYLAYNAQIFPPELARQCLAVGVGGVFVLLVGVADDLYDVSSRSKLLALLCAGAMVCGSGATLTGTFLGGEYESEFRWVGWLLTLLWIAAVPVALNFIDGLDGLAGGLALLAATVLAGFLAGWGFTAAAVIPCAMVGALGGFLPFNWKPAKTFMGDGGALTLGFLIAAMTVVACPLVGSTRGVVLPAIALCVPLVDTALTFFRRRYLQRRSIFSAEQGHVHHRLVERGLSQTQAVLAVYSVSLLAVAIGLVSLAFGGLAKLGGLALLVPLLWGTFRFAGSLRATEMITALRTKRDADRTTRRYHACFETLQLEFVRVTTFADWWQGVCRAAERLDFIRVDLPVTSRDGVTRTLTWTSTDERWADCTRMTATVPIADRRAGAEPLHAVAEVAAATSLESAGHRLALFARLMHEHSLASLARKQPPAAVAALEDIAYDPADRPAAPQHGPFGRLRVAVVHDFLYTYAGAERVVEQLIQVFPHCDLFALFDFLPEEDRGFLQGKPVTTTLLQRMPWARTRHRAYLPLMPLSIEQLDLSQYDLVISSSYLAAKGVITGPDQLHVCYCHSPARYAWDLQHQYLREAGLGYGPRGLLARWVLHYLRSWDVRSALGVDQFVANSRFVARRIEKLYRRDATVVYPPVDTEKFFPGDTRDDFYLVASRLVPYKRTELIVEAFNRTPQRRLKVIGVGPDLARIRKIAGPNVEVLGQQSHTVLLDHMQRAKALVFAAEEDFGIVPVEALACGTPVIAFGRGGVTESVVAGEHGMFFQQQTPESLLAAVDRFEAQTPDEELDRLALRRRAEEFGAERFREEVTRHVAGWVRDKWPGLNGEPATPSTAVNLDRQVQRVPLTCRAEEAAESSIEVDGNDDAKTAPLSGRTS